MTAITRRDALRLGLLGATTLTLAACAPTTSVTADPEGWMPPTGPMPFPAGYTWGAATSAFQVEDSTAADGRGASIWDTFAAQPGRIRDGATGDPAADHYRRWESDLDLMTALGLGA